MNYIGNIEVLLLFNIVVRCPYLVETTILPDTLIKSLLLLLLYIIDRCRKSIRFNSIFRPAEGGEARQFEPSQKFSDLNQTPLQKWKFAYEYGQLSMEATVSKYCRS